MVVIPGSSMGVEIHQQKPTKRQKKIDIQKIQVFGCLRKLLKGQDQWASNLNISQYQKVITHVPTICKKFLGHPSMHVTLPESNSSHLPGSRAPKGNYIFQPQSDSGATLVSGSVTVYNVDQHTLICHMLFDCCLIEKGGFPILVACGHSL